MDSTRRYAAVSALMAAILLCGCTPTAGASDPRPTDSAASTAVSSEEEPAPALADGPLETVSEGEPAIPVDESLIHPGILVADAHVYIVSADNALHAYASDTAEEEWTTTLPRQSLDSGVCAGPEVAEDGTVIVLLGISLGCERRIAIDPADGAIIADELIVDGQAQKETDRQVRRDGTEQLGGDYVVGLFHVDGELWYHTYDDIGRIGERGAVEPVMDAEQLGVVDDEETGDYTAVYEAGELADGGTFVTQLAHVQGDGSDTWSEWIGYDAASAEPRELWRVSEEDPSLFGADGGPLRVFADRPGALVVTQTADGLVHAGVPSPDDGRVAAATIAEDLETALTRSFAGEAEWALLDDGFVTAAGLAETDDGINMLAAYTPAGGEIWRTQMPAIDEYVGDVSGRTGDVHRDVEGATYAVYSDQYSGTRLYRLDTATGEVTGSWDLPEWTVSMDDEHDIRVIGEHVFAVRTSGDDAAGPLVAVWRGTDPAEPSEPSEPEAVPTDVPAATGPVLEVPGAQLHMMDGLEWEILPTDETADGVFQTQGFAQTGEGDIWGVDLTCYPWAEEDAPAAAVTTAELVYAEVGDPTTRTVAGIEAGFVESAGVLDPVNARQVDDLGVTIVLPSDGMTIEVDITVPLDTAENRVALESVIASIVLG